MLDKQRQEALHGKETALMRLEELENELEELNDQMEPLARKEGHRNSRLSFLGDGVNFIDNSTQTDPDLLGGFVHSSFFDDSQPGSFMVETRKSQIDLGQMIRDGSHVQNFDIYSARSQKSSHRK